MYRREGHAFHSLHLQKSSSTVCSIISTITSTFFCRAFSFIHLSLFSIVMNQMSYLQGQFFWKCPGFPQWWQVGGTILWGLAMLMSIGVGAKMGGGTVMKTLGLGRNKMVVVLLRGAELWSLLWKVALASQFSAQYSAASYQASESKSNGCSVGIWVITFWMSHWSPHQNLITIARPSV